TQGRRVDVFHGYAWHYYRRAASCVAYLLCGTRRGGRCRPRRGMARVRNTCWLVDRRECEPSSSPGDTPTITGTIFCNNYRRCTCCLFLDCLPSLWRLQTGAIQSLFLSRHYGVGGIDQPYGSPTENKRPYPRDERSDLYVVACFGRNWLGFAFGEPGYFVHDDPFSRTRKILLNQQLLLADIIFDA